ncbi:hypothetical protein [Longimicrobium sp.]|uniref:hypothetical protein n=1 Tax=Longimicrobium sp. TaxID=2029185 RepID=UPI002E37AEF4|nr:hypothetical protein [Longimicrobium sp.]HEX6038801.1 hypothetical protein [Longimicrobium sp.]
MRKTWLSALPRALTLLITGALLAGCKDPGGASIETYTLASVNQQALPTTYPDPLLPQGFVVTAGELMLKDGGMLSGSFTIACAPGQPAGSTCSVTQPRQTFAGTYSREESWVKLGDRFYPAEYGENYVRFRIYIPQYVGFYPEYDVRFNR